MYVSASPKWSQQNSSSVGLTTFLPDGALHSLSWISAEKWHPVTFPPFSSVNLIHLGSLPVVAFQEQSLFTQLMFLVSDKCWSIHLRTGSFFWCILLCGLTYCCSSVVPSHSLCSSASYRPHTFLRLPILSTQDYAGCLEQVFLPRVARMSVVGSFPSHTLWFILFYKKDFKEFKRDLTAKVMRQGDDTEVIWED